MFLKANLLTSSKIAKRLAVISHMPMILPSPCGCMPKLAKCGCEAGSCFCELELLFCNHAGEWPYGYVVRIGEFLAKVDPLNYAEPPAPVSPVITLAKEARIAAYESRIESGYAIFHPDREYDRKPETWKNGERTAGNRNGRGIQTLGSGEAPDRIIRACWRGREMRVSPIGCDGRDWVEDLIDADVA